MVGMAIDVEYQRPLAVLSGARLCLPLLLHNLHLEGDLHVVVPLERAQACRFI